jgi:hypothetical protein
MATQVTAPADFNGQPAPRAAVIRSSALDTAAFGSGHAKPAWIVSGVFHTVLFIVFYLLALVDGGQAKGSVQVLDTSNDIVVNTTEDDKDLTDTELGIAPGVQTNYDVPRLADVSVPGRVDMTKQIGIENASADETIKTLPPPAGFGNSGQGGAQLDSNLLGNGSQFGQAGGYYNGYALRQAFIGGSGATREQMAIEGGGSRESEQAVGLGLEWLALHQDKGTGKWSLSHYQKFGRRYTDNTNTTTEQFTCKCSGGGQNNDVAATAFGLLPFLAAGQTHKKAPAGSRHDYTKVVQSGLDYLKSKQGSDGYFGGGMYAHGLATITVCEAYGLTADPALKSCAQRALDLIETVQHSGGGWRYNPQPDPGDTSVVGWQVMALKSGQMAGLSVKDATLSKAMKYLDSVQSSDGSGYGYTGPGETPTMTAVGLLCREYLGWTPKNPGLINGVKKLGANPPGSLNSIYYYYYATQVLHHVGGDSWQAWNEKMRDQLIKSQDKGEKEKHQAGSWGPEADAHGSAGGRLMTTSLSLLTLEIYYRHLPLYRRDAAMMKDKPAEESK